MPAPFDPYAQWLGIPAAEQPPDYYRLLGVQQFESEPAVLARAADERMAHVRKFQTGPRGAFTQPILNELAAARLCLLNPASKASYDQMLQGLLMVAAPPVPAEAPSAPVAPIPLQPAAVVVVEPTVRQAPRRQPLRRRRDWTWVWAVGMVALAGAALMFAFVLFSQPDRSQVTEHGNGSGHALPEELLEPRDEPREPVVVNQEANGSVHLVATFAQVHGPSICHAVAGDADVVSAWESLDDWVSWTFKVVQLPPNGFFRVLVTYAARPECDGGEFVLVVGDQRAEGRVRGTGQPVTDEYALLVPRAGEQTLEVRARRIVGDRLMTLRSITLAPPAASNTAPVEGQ